MCGSARASERRPSRRAIHGWKILNFRRSCYVQLGQRHTRHNAPRPLCVVPGPRDKLRTVLILDQPDRDEIAAELLRYGDADGGRVSRRDPTSSRSTRTCVVRRCRCCRETGAKGAPDR